MFRTLLAAALAIAAGVAAAQAVTVNLDARVNVRGGGIDNPVFVDLAAGTYVVTPFAGVFTAWNAWFKDGRTSGCQGDTCARGWINPWAAFTPDTDDVALASFGQGTGDPRRKAWASEAMALANAQSGRFTLTSDQRLGFLIRDRPTTDNAGGMSLRIEQETPAIPLPAAGLLLLTGLGALGLMRRGRG